MLIKAIATDVRISPKKAKVVAALLRGQQVDDALIVLEHTPRRAAKYISKVIVSAKANATHNFSLNEKDLKISSVQVSSSGMMKRWRPAARGSAHPYRHRLSRITVTLEGDKDQPKSKKTTTASASKSKDKKSPEENK